MVGCDQAPAHTVKPAPVPSPTPVPPPTPSPAAPAPVSTPAPLPWGTDDALASFVDDFVGAMGKRWGDPYAFSGIVAIAKDGKPIVLRAYGKANRDTGAVADANTRFRIGSVTKQFTAVCTLQLAEQGKLKVEDTIRTHLPDYPKKTGDKVTLHQLLSHTSGIPSYTDDEALMKADTKDHTPAQVLAVFEDKPLHFEPGTQWEYSNSNFFLLGLIVEKVSGQTYERYLQDHVLGPAGMMRTSTIDAPDAPDTAIGYDTDAPDDGGPLKPAKAISMTLPFAAGALRSTVNDLLRWDRALAGTTLLSEASKTRMFTAVMNDYGYGIAVRTVAGHLVLEHDGGIDGFRSVLGRIPDEGLTIVVLGNAIANPGPVEKALVPMLLEGKRTPPLEERDVVPTTPELVVRVVGDYAMSADSKKELEAKLPKQLMADIARIRVTADGTKLSFKPNGQPKERIFSGGGDMLFSKHAGVEITLEAAANGTAKSFVLRQGALTVRYERTK
jgi:CubicO group peptidase (beta-lactamase class C family)